MAKNLKKYMDMDVIALLEERMKRNTLHYQSDFEIDKQIIERSAKSSSKEDKTLLWMSRPSGTHCHRECEVFTRDSSAHNTWRFYAEQTNDPILACAVELKGIQNGVIRGNVYDLDYKALAADIVAKSVISSEVEKTFEDGFVDRVPMEHSTYGHYYGLVEKHGPIVDSLAIPRDKEQLSLILSQQKQQRDNLKEADTSLDNAHEKLEFIFDDEIMVSEDRTRLEGYLWATDSLVARLKAQEPPLNEDQFMENINFYPVYDADKGTVSLEGHYYLEDGFSSVGHGFALSLSEKESAELMSAFEDYCKKTEGLSCSEFLQSFKEPESRAAYSRASLDSIISNAQKRSEHAQTGSFVKEMESERR